MQIGILGAGHIGGTLGKKWAGAGHTVRFGVRDPNKPEVQELIRSIGGNASAATVADAINFGEVVLFAIPGPTMDETIAANAKILDGKIVIDAANKISAAIAHSLSTFQAQTPKARYVRAFNNYGWGNFEDPLFDNVPADLFYCGPEGDARSAIERLIGDVGLNPVYLGGPEQANAVDGVLRLWFALTSQLKTRQIAFKVLRR